MFVGYILEEKLDSIESLKVSFGEVKFLVRPSLKEGFMDFKLILQIRKDNFLSFKVIESFSLSDSEIIEKPFTFFEKKLKNAAKQIKQGPIK